ncbi:MAG TPA: DUF2242 domain-containing protein [Rhodocyclaceae bacterium]|nr:DUF2242 domain-containing protein [Rhodocyclaceae bacterium]
MKTWFAVTCLTGALLAAGCGGPEVYRDEAFKSDSPFQRSYRSSPDGACRAAELALLSQGYVVDATDATALKARKDFQPDAEINVVIEFNVNCRPTAAGSLVFANAVETRYEVKKSSQSTSISLPSAGSISLPWGKTAEALVKLAAKTVSDREFYARFFTLLQSYLP